MHEREDLGLVGAGATTPPEQPWKERPPGAILLVVVEVVVEI